ncbi:zinc-dependent alcohol dehydrogenase family protein [Streptomyces sp. NPDC005195]|uniref:zinc-dependent alcohol dehydrogenase family protein n=1 Tax=Streptomyces sp. NPDC005195 TaxID=3154561 RepID=UPI0033B7B081
MKGLKLTGHGYPNEVVELGDVPDVGDPGPDEVVIDVEASSVEPTDLYIIAGIYGALPPLPHLLGAQGVGRVSAVGSDVKHLKVGDRTVVPPLSNAWVERVKTSAPWLRPLPDADVNQLAMLGINPATAYLLLTEIVPVQAGEWVVQNAANSGVGRSVMAVAKSKGIKTVNVVRRPELVGELTALGGDIVLVDGPDLPQRIAEATDNAKIALALDGVGGSATQRLLDTVGHSGTVIIYTSMSGEPLTVPGPSLLFANQTIRGFWIVNWFQEQTSFDKITAMYQDLAELVASGALSLPVIGEFTLEQYPEALALAGEYRGKVIFKPNVRQ